MTQPRHEDPTRRHAFVTAGLAAIAALVLVVLEDPAMPMTPGRAGAASSTAAAAAGKPLPLAGQVPYRQFDASVRLVIRPPVVGSTTPVRPGQK
ncbi:hypothetical protein ACHAC9_22955 [Massilia sp. CMS3.1]|uniref:hypothetical protein n=1 Tax=Massilia sp. CMS3.1 TaxID=3373083 RepID=UPI003EE7ABAC